MRSTVAAIAASAVFATGCAFGRVRPDGELVGVAIGHAKLESCQPSEWPDGPWAPPERCQTIGGGALSVSGWEVLGAAVAGAAAYFTGGALP